MKIIKMIMLSFMLLLIFGMSTAFGRGENEARNPAGSPSDTAAMDDTDTSEEPWKYLALFEGLHITGNPIEVDIETYRLEVIGLVENELSFSFDEIKAMDPVTKEVALDCPGFFTDIGDWTGVPLLDLIEQAGPKPAADSVVLTSVDGSYSVSLKFKEIESGGVMVSYHFDGSDFHPYHGYPLRIVADGQPGSKWVKWLGEIRVQ